MARSNTAIMTVQYEARLTKQFAGNLFSESLAETSNSYKPESVRKQRWGSTNNPFVVGGI